MKKVVLIFILFLFCISSVYARNDTIEVKFSKCIDGDTANFLYESEEMKVRFLAVDTPETKHPTKGIEPFGEEANTFTCNALKNAKNITLEFDEGSDELDKYNRYLVWVYVDEYMLQKKLIENGLAKVEYIYSDYKYTDELKNLESIAQENKIGIWGDYTRKSDYTIYYISGALIILAILYLIKTKIKNKEIKKVVNESQKYISKELNKQFKNFISKR